MNSFSILSQIPYEECTHLKCGCGELHASHENPGPVITYEHEYWNVYCLLFTLETDLKILDEFTNKTLGTQENLTKRLNKDKRKYDRASEVSIRFKQLLRVYADHLVTCKVLLNEKCGRDLYTCTCGLDDLKRELNDQSEKEN